MDAKKENAEIAAQDYEARVAELRDPIERLKESLRKEILGHGEAVAAIAKTLAGDTKLPHFTLKGPVGVGKTAAVKAMAEAMFNAKATKTPGVFFIDDPHTMSEAELSDAIALATGNPTRKELGDEAARACREGVAVAPMKKLTLRRGFACI
jgi:ATP-dependent Clp protease ATP-binding subunit ClpA